MSTTTENGQQPNPGEGGEAEAAKPEGAQPNVAGTVEGEGGGGNAAAPGEAKPADGQDEQKPQGAPEAYQQFDVPEGFTLEGERLAEAQALFKELNLPQDQAQKLVTEFCKLSGLDATSLADASEAARAQQIETWGEQLKADLGDKYDATVSQARLAVQAVGSPGLVQAFDQLGWGNHPEMVKAFAHFGSLLAEGGVDTGKTGAPPPKRSAASVLFDHPTSQT